MINKLFCFLFFILIMSCASEKDSKYDYYKKGLYFIEHTNEFEKKNNLYLWHYGINLNSTGKTPIWHEIHQFEVTFISLEKLNLSKTRKKIMNCVQEYLKLINENSELKTHLYKYPFTKDELCFQISFYEKNGKRVAEEYVSLCYLDEGNLYYFITHEDGGFELLMKESFEESLKIIQASND